MSETVHTLTSAHLQNERPIWVRPPREPSSARNLAVFLDGGFYREHVDASTVLDALQGKVVDPKGSCFTIYLYGVSGGAGS